MVEVLEDEPQYLKFLWVLKAHEAAIMQLGKEVQQLRAEVRRLGEEETQ